MMSNIDEKYGKKIEYDPLFKGPMQNIRSPTDRIWLIVFVIYLALYITAAIYGLIAGDIGKLIAPTDHGGRFCGRDSKVKDKPYLLFFDIKECAKGFTECEDVQSVCVPECPKENFEIGGPLTLEEMKEKVYCIIEIDKKSITSKEQLMTLVNAKKCTEWYLKSEPLYGRCVPTEIWSGHESKTISQHDLINFRETIEAAEYLVSKIYNNVLGASGPAVTAIIFGGLIGIAYVALLKWFAVPFFYASICMLLGVLGYAVYWLSKAYATTSHNRNDDKLAQQALIALIVIVLLMVGIIIAVIYFRKKIYLACQLIKESSKAVLHLSSTLVFPLLPGLLYIIVIIFSGLVFMSLSTIRAEEYKISQDISTYNEGCKCDGYPLSLRIDSPCDPDLFNAKCRVNGTEECQLLRCNMMYRNSPPYVYVFHSINLVGFYWLIFFIAGFEYMVLGGAFASWYWAHQKQSVGNYALIESIVRTTRYHLGTIALGSLILTLIQIVRMILQGIQKKLQESDHPIAAVAVSCFRCLFDLIASFVEFLNYNAYIMCAVHGKSFCTSAKNAFNLLMRNVVRIIVVDNVVDILFTMAKLLITSITVGAVFLYYNLNKLHSDPVFTALVMTAIGTYIIVSVFFSVQTIAVKTIFLSFIEDSERNDGSDERPYFMSKKLEKLLHK